MSSSGFIYRRPQSIRGTFTLHLNVHQPRMRRHMNEIQLPLHPTSTSTDICDVYRESCSTKTVRRFGGIASLRRRRVRRHHLVNFPTRPFTALFSRLYMSSVSPLTTTTRGDGPIECTSDDFTLHTSSRWSSGSARTCG